MPNGAVGTAVDPHFEDFEKAMSNGGNETELEKFMAGITITEKSMAGIISPGAQKDLSANEAKYTEQLESPIVANTFAPIDRHLALPPTPPRWHHIPPSHSSLVASVAFWPNKLCTWRRTSAPR